MAKSSSAHTSRRRNEEILQKEDRGSMPLLPANFRLMAIAGVMIVVGFLLMLGGASDFGAFNAEIFSTRRIVVGPTIAFLGFIFMGVAIMYSPRNKKTGE